MNKKLQKYFLWIHFLSQIILIFLKVTKLKEQLALLENPEAIIYIENNFENIFNSGVKLEELYPFKLRIEDYLETLVNQLRMVITGEN